MRSPSASFSAPGSARPSASLPSPSPPTPSWLLRPGERLEASAPAAAPALPGLEEVRHPCLLSGFCPRSWLWTQGLRPPCLLRLKPGLGAEAPPPSLCARALAPALLPSQPAPVSTVWAPHCRCQPVSRSSCCSRRVSLILSSPELQLRVRSLPRSLAGLDSLSPACGVVPAQRRGPGRPTLLSDAAGQADRLPASRRAMPEAPGRRRRWRGHHPEQCAQEAQLHLTDRAPVAVHLGAG